ncbi:chorion class B protein PC10-like isoform X2 [Aricia agestis]|uniref:chorion class B protein PC10-like isoform X2 n=1 Tax=Aricia agestis TaxID=91739 RepID=UPI001C2047AD|nr:chorion class B protein PC10-like isoform X2 [Aricia agestis]
MMTKTLALCILQAVFAQMYCQCIGGYNGYTAEIAAPYAAQYAAAPCAAEWSVGYNPAALAASHGPGLAVTSASPVPPTGVTTVSETALAGELAVAGQVPFLSSVGLEGVLPTVGAGAITYGCGNGAVGITNEEVAPLAPAAYGYAAPGLEYAASPYAYGPIAAGPAYGYGAGYGVGCSGPVY